MTPTVSLIIPVYNVAARLRRCLDSVCRQSYRDIEVILVDDGSSDGSGTICDAYAATDSRIQVMHVPNGGVSRARNLGIDCARGEYIVFSDSDDELEPDYVAHLVMQPTSADLVIAGHRKQLFESGQVLEEARYELRRDHVQDTAFWEQYFADDRFYYLIGKRFKRSLIVESAMRLDESVSYAEDTLFLFEYVSHCGEILSVSACDYIYYKYHAETLSTRPSAEHFFDLHRSDRRISELATGRCAVLLRSEGWKRREVLHFHLILLFICKDTRCRLRRRCQMISEVLGFTLQYMSADTFTALFPAEAAFRAGAPLVRWRRLFVGYLVLAYTLRERKNRLRSRRWGKE